MAVDRGVIVRVGTSYDGKALARAQKDIARLQASLAGPGLALERFGGQVQTLGRRMSTFGATLTRNVTLPLVAAGVGIGVAIQKASDLSETINKVDQIFGASGKSIQDWSRTSATALGQSQQEALDAASTFGIFGKAAGITGSDLVSFSTTLTSLAGDLASFNNTTPAEAIQALGAGLRGESEPLRRFGVLLSDAALKQRALNMGIYDGKGPLTQQQRIMAAYQEVLAQTTTQQGDFARTSGGMANQQRILKATLANVVTELGTAFLPIAQELVALLRDQLVPRIQDAVAWFKQLSPETRRTAVFVAAIAAAMGPVITVMGSMTTSLGGLIAALGPVLTALGGGGLTGALAAIAGPVGIAVAAIAGLVAIFVALWNESEVFRSAVVQAFNQVRAVVSSSVQTIVSALRDNQEAVDTLKGFFKLLGDVIGTYVVPIVRDYLVVSIKALTGAIVGIITVVSRLITGLRAMAVAATAAVATVAARFRGLADTALSVLGAILDGAVSAFGWVPGVGEQLRAAQANFGNFRQSVLGVFDNVSLAAQAMGNEIDSATRDRTVTITYDSQGATEALAGLTGYGKTTKSGTTTTTSSSTFSSSSSGGSFRASAKKPPPVNHWADWVEGMRDEVRKARAQAQLILRGIPRDMAKSITDAPGWKKITLNLMESSKKSLRAYVRLWKKSPEQREAAKAAAEAVAEAAKQARQAQAQQARDAARQLRDQVTSFVSAIKDQFATLAATIRDFGSVSTFQPDAGIPITARGITANLRQRLSMVRDFNKTMGDLQRLGLSSQVRTDIFAMGPMDGLQYAKAILAGGKKAIGEINALTAQFNSPAVAGRFAQLGVEAQTGAQAAALGNGNSIQVGAGAIQITVNGSVTALQRAEIEKAVRDGITGIGREARSSRKAGVR